MFGPVSIVGPSSVSEFLCMISVGCIHTHHASCMHPPTKKKKKFYSHPAHQVVPGSSLSSQAGQKFESSSGSFACIRSAGTQRISLARCACSFAVVRRRQSIDAVSSEVMYSCIPSHTSDSTCSLHGHDTSHLWLFLYSVQGKRTPITALRAAEFAWR